MFSLSFFFLGGGTHASSFFSGTTVNVNQGKMRCRVNDTSIVFMPFSFFFSSFFLETWSFDTTTCVLPLSFQWIETTAAFFFCLSSFTWVSFTFYLFILVMYNPCRTFFFIFSCSKKKKRKGTHICRFISVKARRLFLLSVINVFCSLSLSLVCAVQRCRASLSPFLFFIFSVGRKYDCYECSATSPWVEKERIWSACIRFFYLNTHKAFWCALLLFWIGLFCLFFFLIVIWGNNTLFRRCSCRIMSTR